MGYVPLSFNANEHVDTDVNGAAPNQWFDIAVNCIPTDACHVSSFANDEIDASNLGDPMTRIRVSVDSEHPEHQMIAISVNHSLVDAGSISLFMSAWSRHNISSVVSLVEQKQTNMKMLSDPIYLSPSNI